MKYEEIIVDGKKEKVVVDFDHDYEDDRLLDDNFENTTEIPLIDNSDTGDNNG